MIGDTGEETHPQFRDSGASSNMYLWKIRGARGLMQGDLLYVVADHGMCIAIWRCFWWSTIMHRRTATTEKNDDCVLDHEPRKVIHESTEKIMTSNDLHYYFDLRRADFDPELFAAAVALHYIRRLIVAGGGSVERPDEEEEVLSPHHLEAFLARAVVTAHRTKRFEQEWRRLHRLVPQIQVAWERGQVLVQDDVVRVTSNPEEMEYLSHIDFALDCYAAVDARKAYPHDRVLQAWATDGYMMAWWQHFLAAEDASL
jgi:hypothetical protein